MALGLFSNVTSPLRRAGGPASQLWQRRVGYGSAELEVDAEGVIRPTRYYFKSGSRPYLLLHRLEL